MENIFTLNSVVLSGKITLLHRGLTSLAMVLNIRLIYNFILVIFFLQYVEEATTIGKQEPLNRLDFPRQSIAISTAPGSSLAHKPTM